MPRISTNSVNLNIGSSDYSIPGFTNLDMPSEWYGKAQERKGKRLFMPIRIALTGSMQGPDVGEVMRLLAMEDGDVQQSHILIGLDDSMKALHAWVSNQ